MDFKSRLKEEMEYAGIQHKELAVKAGIKPRALLTYVASSPSMPSADVAVRLARALGVTVEYLVTGEKSRDGFSSLEEKKLVQNYARLSPTEKNAVQSLVQILSSSHSSLEEHFSNN